MALSYGHSKSILRLALPSIMANITIPLLGLVDIAIVGHLSDAASIGGIAIGTMLFDLLYWNFAFLRVGTSGMTAQAFGRGDVKACSHLLIQSLSIALGATLVIWLLQWFFLTAVLACIPCTQQVADFAEQYFYIRIWAAPATLSLFVFKGWFIGLQDTVSPMICDVTVNVVNMAVSYYLAVYTPLGALGVAYGTVVAQFIGLLFAITLLLSKYRIYINAISHIKEILNRAEIRHLLSLNSNLFIRSLCFMVVYVGFTSIASAYGDTLLAISGIIMKLFMLFSYFVDGFAYAGEALVGRYIGEKSEDKVSSVVKALCRWGLGVGILFMIIYGIWGRECVALLTTDSNVISSTDHFIIWLILMPIVSTMAFTWDGIYIGATAGKELRDSMIISAAGFAVTYTALYKICGIQALYAAYFVHLALRALYLSVKWNSTYNTTFKEL